MTGRRFWAFNGVLFVAVALIAYFGLSSLFHRASAHAATRTATVQTGTVTQTVTASGNVSPAQSENLNFGTGGTVTSVNVSVGDTVTAGQTLATLDPAPAQAALTAAQDDLTAAEDNLATAQNGNESPPQVAQDNAAVAADQQAVASDQATLTSDQAQLASDQAACAKSASAASAGGSAQGTSSGGSTTGSSAATSGTNPCTEATAEQQVVTQAQASLTQAQNVLDQENLSIAAKRYVSPAVILQDQAQVATAQENVAQDQKTLSETTLVAPFDGTVTALSGAVGETVGGGGNSSASSASAGSGGGGSGGGSSSASSSGSSSSSSGFLTLANLSDLQVVAGFPEASAVKVKVGQPATVTLSATNATVSGAVTAISPTPTVVSNVVTYDVTVSLQNPPSSVRTGMSTTVAVVVASASNALELPSSAITTTGGRSTVELLKNGKQVLTPVTVGLVGDTDTQILSGLSAGEQVAEPSVTVSSSGATGTTGRGFGGLGGGFGGGLGGGFGGGAAARGG